ncbi:MAG: transposase, partial [Verrucomicrobia bacterium]|nr:transposase [Verrucomicrobiota bacterium]
MALELLAGNYIQADETPVGVQSERVPGRNHRAYLWQYSRPGATAVFDFRVGRERDARIERQVELAFAAGVAPGSRTRPAGRESS